MKYPTGDQLARYLKALPPELAIEALLKLRQDATDEARLAELDLALALQYKKKQDVQRANQVLSATVARAEPSPELLFHYGGSLLDIGKTDEGLAAIRQSWERDPQPWPMTVWLFQGSRMATPPTDLIPMHFRYGEVVNGAPHVFSRPKRRERLKVAYISGDFRYHSVYSFAAPVLRHHDPDAVELYVFMAGPEDFKSAELRQQANCYWYNIEDWDEATVLKTIRALGIDVLVDLSGHTKYTQLPVFGKRAAPVQVSWLAYMLTTGVHAMDYRFSNEGLIDKAHLDDYVEQIYWLPRTTAVWESLVPPPEIADVPSAARGYVTFAVLGASSKITPPAIRAWMEILRGLPDARLVLMYAGRESSESERRQMVARDFPADVAERIELLSPLPVAEYLDLFARIDIVLDTFPVTGGTNTLYALRMGVPTITIDAKGEMNGVGADLNGSLGFHELVAHDVPDYVARAIELARDLPQLQRYRQTMPALILSSTLSDYRALALDMENAYRDMYQQAIAAGRILERDE